MINWRVRFNMSNITFIVRFIAALLIPVLAYLGLQESDLTSWPILWQVIKDFISNPYLIALTVFNALNMVPDPTVKGISDSKQALGYRKPKDDKYYIR